MTIQVLVEAMKEAFVCVLNSLTEFGFEPKDLKIELLDISGNFAVRVSKQIQQELKETLEFCKQQKRIRGSYFFKDDNDVFFRNDGIIIIEGCPSFATSLLIYLLSLTKTRIEKNARETKKKFRASLTWGFQAEPTECSHCGKAIPARKKMISQEINGKTEKFCSVKCAEDQNEFELESNGIYHKIEREKNTGQPLQLQQSP